MESDAPLDASLADDLILAGAVFWSCITTADGETVLDTSVLDMSVLDTSVMVMSVLDMTVWVRALSCDRPVAPPPPSFRPICASTQILSSPLQPLHRLGPEIVSDS